MRTFQKQIYFQAQGYTGGACSSTNFNQLGTRIKTISQKQYAGLFCQLSHLVISAQNGYHFEKFSCTNHADWLLSRQ